MDRFERLPPERLKEIAVGAGWPTPLVNLELYEPLKPLRRAEVWSGARGDLYAARFPDWVHPPQANYTAALVLMEQLLGSVKKHRKVLVVPDASVSTSLLYSDPRLERHAREAGVSRHVDFQAVNAPPALLAGVVDALLEAGAEEVHVLIDSPWHDPLRVAWDAGYAMALAGRGSGRVFFVNPYAGEQGLARLAIKWIEGYDTGFYTHVDPPQALFKEKYDLVVAVSPAKTHALNLYSLLLRTLGRLWRPPRTRWHALGFPLKLFKRSYLSEVLGIDVPEGRDFSVIQVGERAMVTNGFACSPPLPICPEEGEMLAICDPHTGSSSLLPLQLSMGYSTVRYISSYATVLDELEQGGTRVVGIASAIVGVEGEGPLIYGKRRFDSFAVAGESVLAAEELALDAMFGAGARGFEGAVIRLNRRFCDAYVTDEELEEDIMLEAADPWTLKLAEELVREERDPSRYTLTLVDFDSEGAVSRPWDLRAGPPFKLPKLAYVTTRTILRAVVEEPKLYRRALYPVEKGISVPVPEFLGV